MTHGHAANLVHLPSFRSANAKIASAMSCTTLSLFINAFSLTFLSLAASFRQKSPLVRPTSRLLASLHSSSLDYVTLVDESRFQEPHNLLHEEVGSFPRGRRSRRGLGISDR
ncbi:hypothetical protein MLD38_024763 [Melastoma candidum]|uniref:Uncharacterized protein n=1 Tax=Melastoma candidum TaxID=119954 RepID=A0ACB9NYE6_9MYRT|nr:hypothetical protein MLD38_024763 [Melastoma candidum]